MSRRHPRLSGLPRRRVLPGRRVLALRRGELTLLRETTRPLLRTRLPTGLPGLPRLLRIRHQLPLRDLAPPFG
ncbi:hypothetical protein [Actinophytocola xinjiangensis]|uniref:hypothetical protein n=1 Tax=Actinophytocola xinjiangensis TaxID=485602 RepID=UPI001FEC3A38|nr:hypothetical protein [Actinophytocola xinjiangensis]